MKKYVVKTLGCKANFYDSQLMEAELQKRGWLPAKNPSKAEGETQGEIDLCIVNSCTVTDEADRQTRKMAARLFRENPNARVVVTGCGAEVEPERLTRSQGVHYVIGNQDKPRLVDLILEKFDQKNTDSEKQTSGEIPGEISGQILGHTTGYSEMLSRHPIEREWPVVESSFVKPPVHLDGDSGKTRAFLKIQEGCNSFCTYCIIPYGRGPARSLAPENVISQIQSLVTEGVREVVLTGTNLGDYGTDWGTEPVLGELVERIFKETDLERLRVSSLDPTEIPEKMLQLMENEKRFCPHFHISLQSPDSRILRLMKRKYSAVEVKKCLEQIAAISAPIGGVFVGMDVITGFPGETDDDFQKTYEALESFPWSRLHVFPYSERTGTPATRLPGSVPREKRFERSQKLKELSQKRLLSIHLKVLQACQNQKGLQLDSILLEKPIRIDRELRANGYTSNYLRVILEPLADGTQNGLDRNAVISATPFAIHEDPVAGDVAFLART